MKDPHKPHEWHVPSVGPDPAELASAAGPPAFEPGEEPSTIGALPNSPMTLAWSMVWLFVTAGVLNPMLPLYLTAKGLTESQIGFLLAVPPLASMLASQPGGYIADRLLTRPRFLQYLCVGGLITSLIYPWLPSNKWCLGIGLFVFYTFTSNRISILNSLVLASNRGVEIYSRVRFAGSFSFGVFALIAGWLADHTNIGIVIIWPMVAWGEMMTLVTMPILKDTPPRIRHVKAPVPFAEVQAHFIRDPVMRSFLIFTLVTQLTMLSGVLLQPRLLHNLGADAFYSAGAMTLGIAAELVIFYFGQQILARFPLSKLMAASAGAIAIRWALIYLFPIPPVIFASNIINGLTFGLAFLAGVHFVNQETPRAFHSSGQSIFGMMFFSVPMLLGNLLAGTILRFTDLQHYYGWIAVFSAVSMLTYRPFARALTLRASMSRAVIPPAL